jgi:Diacylglycerol acyltransferase
MTTRTHTSISKYKYCVTKDVYKSILDMKVLTAGINRLRQKMRSALLFVNMCILVPMWMIGICTCLYVSLVYVAFYYDPSYILLTLLLAYLLYILYDRIDGPTGRRYYRNKYQCEEYDKAKNWSCFKNMASYFPITLHKTVDISCNTSDAATKSAYIFLYQPHGVIGMGVNTAINTNGCGFDQIFPNVRLHYGVTLDVPFYVPFLRDFIISLGFVHARKSTLEHILHDRRESIVLVPGGAMEALYTKNGTFRCLCKTAPIRLALSTNAAIVPCLGFGESDAFQVHTFPPDSTLFAIQKYLCQTFSFSTPLLLSPFAQRHPINVVIGAPIYFPKIDNGSVSDEFIVKYQKQYRIAVEKLYVDHRDRFGHISIPLEWILK